MTCALSWPLQQALFEAIRADTACAAWLGDRVYDAAPPFGPDSDRRAAVSPASARRWFISRS